MNASSLGIVVAAVAALGTAVFACGSTTNNNAVTHSSALGQTCSQTADCEEPLVCIQQTCVASGAPVEGGAGSGEASASGSSSGGSVAEAAAPHLGMRGDACQATADCGPSLDCIYTGLGGGVCDLASYNLGAAATGMTCTGECKTAADCCELPVDVTINGTTYHDCNDLLNQVIGGAQCSSLTAPNATAVGVGCFYYNTYCNGCGSTWACTSGQCVYQPACQASGAVLGGCAPETRTGRPLPTSCNGGTCSAPSAGACMASSDCAGQAYVPFPGEPAGTCRAPGVTGANDCSCQNGGCYLGCAQDLDCAAGYTCDTTTNLCKASGSCQTDAECAASQHNVLSKCASGTCTVPCTTDHDCSKYSGATGVGSFNGTVCNSGTCTVLGCTADSDCNVPDGASVHLFCVAPAAAPAPPEVSAITN